MLLAQNFLPRGAAKAGARAPWIPLPSGTNADTYRTAAHVTANATVETIQQTLQGQTYDVDYYFYPCDKNWGYNSVFGPNRPLWHWTDQRDLSVGSDGNGMCQSALAGVDIEYNGLKAGILGGACSRSVYLMRGS